MQKILTLEHAAVWSAKHRESARSIVATNGCFDILHVGHVRYLERARSLGALLIVGINGDNSVRQLKGEARPINAEHDRAEVLAALASVDAVVIFPEVRATRFLEAVQPAIYVKGGDYTAETLHSEERELLEKFGTDIQIIPFEAGYSTTSVIERLQLSDG